MTKLNLEIIIIIIILMAQPLVSHSRWEALKHEKFKDML